MRAIVSLTCLGAGASLIGACALGNQPTGPGVEISVAPLTLPGLSNVCFDLAVLNGAPTPDGDSSNDPDTVWSKANVCSTTYGNGAGGDITYIGTCDAGVSAHNYVLLTLADVFAGSATPLMDQLDAAADPDVEADYINPCPTGAPCMLDFECVENADTLVTFNLTIMRRANQGFFDIAVNFDDIFCSAKLDCQYATGPIELLHDPRDAAGGRGQTAVLAFACTSGPGAKSETLLHMGPITVTCGADAPILIDPSAGPGNAYTAATPDPYPSDAIWQYAIYRGAEDLDCGEVSCNKLYWNTAIGFDADAEDCNVTASATASTIT